MALTIYTSNFETAKCGCGKFTYTNADPEKVFAAIERHQEKCSQQPTP